MTMSWPVIFALCLPVIAPSALYAKLHIPRLPEAKGKRFGSVGNSDTDIRHLTFIGESPVVGVGVETIDKGVVAKTAKELSKIFNCTMNWHAVGVNGINITDSINDLSAKINDLNTDYLVICLGVNDTKELTRFSVWESEITRFIDIIRSNSSCEIFFLPAPDMSCFTALPHSLGWLLGYRARILNLITENHPYCGPEYHFIPSKVHIEPEYLAEDGFHPSEKGCTIMGKTISHYIVDSVTTY